MFFKKNKPAPQSEAKKMPSLQSSASEGHSLFAPTINPMPGMIDFGFGQIQTPNADNPPAMASEVLPPLPQTEPAPWEQPSYESTPLPWENEPSTNGFEQTETFTANAQAMPLISPDLSPEQAWEAMSQDFPLPQQAAPLGAWEPEPVTPEFIQPEATQPYLGETFENYVPPAAYQPETPLEPQPGIAQESEPNLFEQFEQPFQPDMQGDFAPIPLEPATDFSANLTDFPSSPPFQSTEEPLPFAETAATLADDFTLLPPLEFDNIASNQNFPQAENAFSEEEPEASYLLQNPPIPQSEERLWNNLNTELAIPGEQVPLDPAAFLDSINQQLYPADPLQSVHPELNESEQAFEEAAQFLFPETMGATLDWSADDASEPFFPSTTLDSAEMAGFEEGESFDLGASFQSETAGINDLSGLMGEAPQDTEEEETAPLITDLSEFQITSGTPPDADEQTIDDSSFLTANDSLIQAFEQAAPHFEETDATAFLSEPTTKPEPDLFESAAYNLETIPLHADVAGFQPYATEMAESGSLGFDDELDDEEDAPTYDFSAYASEQHTVQFPPGDEEQDSLQTETSQALQTETYQTGLYQLEPEPADYGPITTYSTDEESETGFAAWPSLTTDERLTNSLGIGFEALPEDAPGSEEIPSYDLSPESADLAYEKQETLFATSYNLSNVPELGSIQASAANADYTEEDTWFGETDNQAHQDNPPYASGPAFAEPESSLPAFESEVAFESDEDFYATSFMLNEQGELVPTDATGQPIPYIPAAPPIEIPAPLQASTETAFIQPSPIEEAPIAFSPAVPEPWPVVPEAESVLEFASLGLPSSAIPDMEPEPTWTEAPKLAVEPLQPQAKSVAPSNEPSLPMEPAEKTTPMQTFKSAEASYATQRQAPAESIRQPEIPTSAKAPEQPYKTEQASQPKPFKPQTRAQNPPQYKDELEAQWHSPLVEPRPPVTQKAAPPNVASELMLGNLEVLSVCSLSAEKRLLVIHNKGIFALMGQYGMEQPQISVLKVFDHNPIAYQNTFTAVEEGQAGSQGMFVVQVGTWHAIISTFQDKITLHTELG